jgi:hypothetical protein
MTLTVRGKITLRNLLVYSGRAGGLQLTRGSLLFL